MLLLGVVSLAGGRARSPGSLAFSGFAILWASHVLAGQWMAYVAPDLAPRVHLTYLALLLPLPYLLVQLARAFTKDGATRALWRIASGAALAAAIGAIAALILAPELVYEGASARGFPQWGPLYLPLAVGPFFAALGLALVTLDAARRASATARTAQRHALLAAGLATFTAFSAGNNAAYYALDALTGPYLPATEAHLALFGALAAIALVVGARAARDAARAPSPKTRQPALILACATLVPLAWGVVEGALAYNLLPRFNTVGLWRLVGVALLAYALARWRMPELAPRSRQTTAMAMGVAASATSGGLVAGVFLLLTPAIPLVVLAALVVPIATLSPSVRLARRVLRADAPRDLTDATLAPRLETYRAALEASVARNSLEEDGAFLDGLRERLAISPDVHEALLCLARASTFPPPDATHPGYERLRLLGEGAQGRAWLARRRADDELVVLKETPAEDAHARAALVRQARLAQRVRHPRLVRIREVVEASRGAFVVMDHMAGGSLAERIERGPLPPGDAARHAADVLDALDALHRAGLTHGDVKPANVLLDHEGSAHLADFGLLREGVADATRTHVGAPGTLSSMAPEQLDGAPATPATDVYAAGALLHRLLTGEHYLSFGALDEVRARELVRRAPPRLPHPRVPPALEPILARALAKDPAARYAGARQMRAALDEARSAL